MQIEIKQELAFGHRWPVAELRAALSGARKTVLVAHLNADGDAVGSVTGMAAALRLTTTGCVTAMLPDGVPDDLRWLPGTDGILSGRDDADRCADAIAEADLVVALDVSTLDRTGVLAEKLKASKADKILIDHHIGPDAGQFGLMVSEPDASSTCELVFWVMRLCFGDAALDRDAATCLYTGICTDTGTFSYSNDRPSVYTAAALLLAYGIDPMAINRNIRNVFTTERLRFFGHAADTLMTVYGHQRVALVVIHASDMEAYGVKSADLTGLINEVMRLHDIDCGILVREEPPTVRLSLRSKEMYDVNQLARDLFGGGGHERAAGATSTLTLDETVARVKEKLQLER